MLACLQVRDKMHAMTLTFWVLPSTILNIARYTINPVKQFWSSSLILFAQQLLLLHRLNYVSVYYAKYALEFKTKQKSPRTECCTKSSKSGWKAILTFLCWWSGEIWRFRRTKVFRTVPRPSIVSWESGCLGARQWTGVDELEVDRAECVCLGLSSQSLRQQTRSSHPNFGCGIYEDVATLSSLENSVVFVVLISTGNLRIRMVVISSVSTWPKNVSQLYRVL